MVTTVPFLVIERKYPLKIEEKVKSVLKEICLKNYPLEESFKLSLSHLFSLKMEIIYQLVERNVDFKMASKYLEGKVTEFEKVIEKRGNLVLAMNVGFALRVSMDIMNSILETFQFGSSLEDNIDSVYKIKLDDFISLISIQPLPSIVRHSLIEMTRIDTLLTFAVLLALFYGDGELEIIESKVKELAVCLRDWAQLYGALAQELQIWSGVKTTFEEVIPQAEKEEIEEEKRLAELGVKDYIQNLLKDEKLKDEEF